jgi:hypothetical protein
MTNPWLHIVPQPRAKTSNQDHSKSMAFHFNSLWEAAIAVAKRISRVRTSASSIKAIVVET